MRRSANSRPSASSRDRKDSTRLSESIKKSAGPTSPASPDRNLAAPWRLSSAPLGGRATRRQSRVRDHASVPPARGPVREEVLPVVGATPGRERDSADPQRLGLLPHRGAETHAPRRALGAPAELAQHFRTYFIALTANTYSTMHYDISRPCQRHPLHELHAALQDASRRSAPAGVQQRHHSLLGRRDVDRDAIGDGDREQEAAS